jgi:alpha-L-rhamnosidase
MAYFPKSSDWVKKALNLRPKLLKTIVSPSSITQVEKSTSAFSGWQAVTVAAAAEVEGRSWEWGESFALDFGDHHVGHLRFELACEGELDAPARLRVVFAELPVELGEPFDPYTGTLSRSWLQDEILTFDLLPLGGEFMPVTLPRRYAFRYVRVELDSRAKCTLRFRNIEMQSVTSADESQVPALEFSSPWKELDEISRRTLRNCMQEVFEDGPKRDRRLWMGDLRLQALANAATFKNFSLVKRCLYFFAGLTNAEGMVNGCVYEYPSPHGTEDANPIDYAFLFGPTLLEYAQASGDWELARELWPVALRQLDFGWQDVDEKGVWHNRDKRWTFIDWNDVLIKQPCVAGVLAFSIRQTMLLAQSLGMEREMEDWKPRLEKLVAGTRSAFWNDQKGVAICEGQISWLANSWLVLGGILSGKEAAPALLAAIGDPEAIRPLSPYGCHAVIEALLRCQLKKEASALLRDFWGGMVELDADTFWEVWNPADHRTTPYGNPLLNSACHAWSCTPTYFIRNWPDLMTD